MYVLVWGPAYALVLTCTAYRLHQIVYIFSASKMFDLPFSMAGIVVPLTIISLWRDVSPLPSDIVSAGQGGADNHCHKAGVCTDTFGSVESEKTLCS